jgi:aryl-phospho-beta-D-glucosidase BglC (GH1 family)
MRSIIAFLLFFLVAAAPTLAPMVVAAPSGQGFLSTRGTSIVDSTGQVVQLRGANYPGYQDTPPQGHSQSAYSYLAQLGFNVVRLPISWANLEPQPGVFDSQLLTWWIDEDVIWAGIAGVRIVLDMHQYYWAAKFGGGGAPVWSVQQYPANQVGLRQAVSDFWADATLQDHLISVWRQVAQHYANQPVIAGYDILNEPWVYTTVNPTVNATSVDNFYAKAVQAIRQVDRNHLIFLEPANLNTFKFPATKNIFWSPHFYQLSFTSRYYPQNFTILKLDFEAKYKTFVQVLHTPMWIGEFGAFMPDKSSRMEWAQDVVKLFNGRDIGWAWWAYTGDGSIPSALAFPYG